MFIESIRRLLVLYSWLALVGPLAYGQSQPAAPPLDAARKEAVIDEVASLLNKNYIFLDTARKLEDALRTAAKNRDFDKSGDARSFAQAVSRILLDVGKDRHMGFVYAPDMAADIRKMRGQSEAEAQKVRERQLQQAQRENFGFRKVELLPGNIGYLDFRVFASPDQAGPTAIAALNFLAHCDAIIIDLRQNGGGDPAQIQLIASYFFPEMTHLNDIYFREGDRMENFWTLPFVPGAKPVHAELFILTSSRTFSGAEEFTYNMKNLKRATVIGETTGGGAHPTRPMIVQNDFVLRVPFARAINPISKTNWEGTGVTPDIAVPAAEAYDRAYTLAVEKLRTKASDPGLKARYEWILDGLKAKTSPAKVDEKTLQTYAGTYGERKVTFENGVLYYQRTGPKYRLAPMTQYLFELEGLDNFRVEFVVKEGKPVELVGHYDNGTHEPSPRTN